MPATICINGPAFSMTGQPYFSNMEVDFHVVPENAAEQGNILATEWYLDGVLILNNNSLSFGGNVSCGSHQIGARILSAGGWSGIKSLVFNTCKVITAVNITGPANVDEGTSARYYITRSFSDGSSDDITGLYTLIASGYGSFNGNRFTAIKNDQSYDSYPVDITAVLNGIAELTRQIIVQNTTPVIVAQFNITGPAFIDEGSSAVYSVIAAYTDGTQTDVSTEYTFSCAEGYFNGLTYFAPTDDTPGNTRTVTITATRGDGTQVTRNVTIKDTYGIAGILVVDLFNNTPLNAVALIDNPEVAYNHDIAYTGKNIVPAGSAPAQAAILASDLISQPTLKWRFEFNISKLTNEYPNTNNFIFYIKGRSSSPGTISGAFVLKTLQTIMTLTGSPGNYLPSAIGNNLGQSTQFNSQVQQGLNGSYNEANLLTIIRLNYDVQSKTISYTVA